MTKIAVNTTNIKTQESKKGTLEYCSAVSIFSTMLLRFNNIIIEKKGTGYIDIFNEIMVDIYPWVIDEYKELLKDWRSIKVYNVKTKALVDGTLIYQDRRSNQFSLSLEFNKSKIESNSENYADSLDQIREEIYPWIPMVVGSLNNIVPMKGNNNDHYLFYGNYIFGETINIKKENIVRIFDRVQDTAYLCLPKIQKAMYNLRLTYLKKNKYHLDSFNIVILEKNINTDKYEYFWIYDKDNNKVYDIKNINDIHLFKKGKLPVKWQNLDSFIAWYADNIMNDTIQR